MTTAKIDRTNILLPSYRGRLLEGVTYNSANNSLLWVDIISAEVHRVNLDDESKLAESHQVLKFTEPGESVGAVLLTKDPDTVLVCAKYGVAKANFATKKFNYLLKYPLPAQKASRLRSNDGIIDPWGNIWIGLMNDFPTVKAQGKVEPEGLLYRISATDLSVKLMVEDALIPNGLSFNKNGTKFYWTDSLTFTVWQFDYDNNRVELSNRKPLIDMRTAFPGANSPEPDGHASTTDGHIFQAVFSQATVLKYNVSGEVEERFAIPAERVTCAGLGGKNDDEMYVTTAHPKLDDFSAEIDAFDQTGDLGGFLFRVKLDKKVNSTPTGVWAGSI